MIAHGAHNIAKSSKLKKLGTCDELKEKIQRRNWNSDKLIDLSM